MTEQKRRSFRILLGASAGCALAFASPAIAQGAPDSNSSPSAAQDAVADADSGLAIEQADITVTASRVRASGFNAPTPTTVLGEEVAERTAATTVADMLTQVPSFRLTGIAGTTSRPPRSTPTCAVSDRSARSCSSTADATFRPSPTARWILVSSPPI